MKLEARILAAVSGACGPATKNTLLGLARHHGFWAEFDSTFRRMLGEGKLVKIGSRRGARYGLPRMRSRGKKTVAPKPPPPPAPPPPSQSASWKSLRDYFAAAALQGYLSGNPGPNRTGTQAEYADRSYHMADAMLKRREEA